VYAENLPAPASTDCSADGTPVSGLYTRKHAPWTYFTNVDHNNERPYSELAGVLATHTLPNLTFIIPNNCHNTHNDLTPGCMLPDGDTWLSQNLPPILAELGPNGLLILTWDEDDTSSSQHILTVFVGPKVIPGAVYDPTIRHYTVTKLICDVLGIEVLGYGIFEEPILGIWNDVTASRGTSWGRLKTIYR
jgi:acid phosphatase